MSTESCLDQLRTRAQQHAWEQARARLLHQIELATWEHLYQTYRHGVPVEADDWRNSDPDRVTRADATTVPGCRVPPAPTTRQPVSSTASLRT